MEGLGFEDKSCPQLNDDCVQGQLGVDSLRTPNTELLVQAHVSFISVDM